MISVKCKVTKLEVEVYRVVEKYVDRWQIRRVNIKMCRYILLDNRVGNLLKHHIRTNYKES